MKKQVTPIANKEDIVYNQAKFPETKLVEIMDNDEIQERVEGLAKNIESYIAEKTGTLIFQQVIYVGVMDGCVMFYADLLRHQTRDVRIVPITHKSYKDNKKNTKPSIVADFQALNSAKVIVICDTICDSGTTFENVKNLIQFSNPEAIIITTSLLYKEHSTFKPDFIGKIIPNDWFVVGYGMDDRGLRRTFPAIYRVNEGENE